MNLPASVKSCSGGRRFSSWRARNLGPDREGRTPKSAAPRHFPPDSQADNVGAQTDAVRAQLPRHRLRYDGHIAWRPSSRARVGEPGGRRAVVTGISSRPRERTIRQRKPKS